MAAVLAWLVAVPIVGIDLLVRPGGGAAQQVGLGSVVTVSLLASLLGWGLLALLERLVRRRALTAWTVVAVVVLMLSLTGPLTAAANAAVAIALVPCTWWWGRYSSWVCGAPPFGDRTLHGRKFEAQPMVAPKTRPNRYVAAAAP